MDVVGYIPMYPFSSTVISLFDNHVVTDVIASQIFTVGRNADNACMHHLSVVR